MFEFQDFNMLSVEAQTSSNAEIVDFQELACEIIRQAWLDSGSHRPNEVRGAVQFCLSRDFDLWAELAELSTETRERIRVDIEERAEVAQGKRHRYLAKQRERRASR